MNQVQKRLLSFTWILFLGVSAFAQQPLRLRCDPAQTTANFTLSATLHSVHGAFRSKQCELRFDPATGVISGEIVFDATSGNTGNEGRDKKMHNDVLESGRYPEIAFRPDRVEGKVADGVASSLTVHGMFRIHGVEHELNIPVDAKLASDHWEAHAQFKIPYIRWGMKNPSKAFLRVGDTVEVEFQGEGKLLAQ
ncbi:MAG TPA: YceI family protein [Terriglobales bacterium]|nr:YceI family protein [Terriglobales bacterium]